MLDRSGSMGGSKMSRAVEAAGYCVDQFLPADRLSVVIFDDIVEVLIPSQPVEDKAGLRRLLSRVGARGSTALHEAWVRGGMQVSEHLGGAAVNRVVLITDGLANVGLTDTDEIVSQARGLFERGVTLGLVPSDGVRVADVLNDFELTETGRYRLPDLQAGCPRRAGARKADGHASLGSGMPVLMWSLSSPQQPLGGRIHQPPG